MIEKIKKLRSNMAFGATVAIVLLLSVFGAIICASGVFEFTRAYDTENENTSYHIAYTAASLVNGDHIDEYLAGEEAEEYNRTGRILDSYCDRMSVSLVYVIAVDRSDYGSFVSVFNAVNNKVDNTNYTVWELGHERDTTNAEYAEKYRLLYEQGSPFETVYRFNPGAGLNPHITTLVPIRNDADEVTALLCIQRPIHELEKAVKHFVIRTAIFMLLLAAVASRLAAYFVKKSVVLPIRKVSEEAARFASENTKGEELGDVSGYKEIYSLSRSIDKMETDMVSYMEHLTKVTAEKGKIETELSFAKKIQSSSLPSTFPAFPDRPEFDIYATMSPAREVGGDFYNFILIDDDHLAMWIGDVADKGVPAALFMMAINIVIDNRARMGGTPAQIMHFVNNSICEHNSANLFVTIWLGILEISTGKLTFVNAGHEEMALYRKGGEFALYKTKHNMAVGVIADIEFTDFEIVMKEGDKLFVYTDGVPEATDQNDKMFTTDRMLRSLNQYRDGTPQEILEGVHGDINEFVGDRPQFDDLTMLGFELKK